MQTRQIGPFEVSAIGLGCMSLSHSYGPPPPREQAERVLLGAIDAGHTFFDTAAVYGLGHNERLVGEVLKAHRDTIVLASKCGMTDGEKRDLNGAPERLKATCDESLARLGVEVIDLYYLHRWDKRVPIEDSIGAMSDMVRHGKVRAIGISEVSAGTLRRAHHTHPIAAVQTEYSLWTRNPEVAVLKACRELGIAFVAFSPLARGFLTGDLRETAALPAKDIRHAMPRFQAEHYPKNLKLLDGFSAIARENNCTMAQLALAGLLAKDDILIPIPGTTRLDHLAENAGAAAVCLNPNALARMDALINPKTVSGPRYNEATQAEIDTEGV